MNYLIMLPDYTGGYLCLLGKPTALSIRITSLLQAKYLPWDGSLLMDATGGNDIGEGVVHSFVGSAAELVWGGRLPGREGYVWEMLHELWALTGKTPRIRQFDVGGGVTVSAPGCYEKMDRLFVDLPPSGLTDRDVDIVARILNVPPEAVSICRKEDA